MKRGTDFRREGSRTGRLLALPVLLIGLTAAAGCGKGHEVDTSWPDSPMPDGSTPLRVGMSVDELRQTMGTDGVSQPAPAEASYKEAIDFDHPQNFPNVHVFVGTKDKKVVGWKILRPSLRPASGPSGRP